MDKDWEAPESERRQLHNNFEAFCKQNKLEPKAPGAIQAWHLLLEQFEESYRSKIRTALEKTFGSKHASSLTAP